jgi:aspartate--ammonia ligase
MKTAIPIIYTPKLDFVETEKAIKLVKDTFERSLSKRLHLLRVSAPRFLKVGKGLQDDLAGTQTPVGFKTKFTSDLVEVVHSLAKWKRYTLWKYAFKPGTGLYTDMDAIRKDEDIDEIHSIYVDQWDWERVITIKDRSLSFLKGIVKEIYVSILETQKKIEKEFPKLKKTFPKEIRFVHSEELEEIYPKLSPKEREYEIAKKYGVVFLIGIGHPLRSGKPHDLRAADYDDWSTKTELGKGLNGDLLVWDDVRKDVLELSSMGIRVDAQALDLQLKHMGLSERRTWEFHKAVLEDKMCLSIGGGIGQSRLCMFLLQKAHIGEVQSSVWPVEVEKEFAARKIPLL